ncbi:MAG: polysaccharide pyruvyl transferase family protein, partial [Perlabentimonas sp.]
MKKTKIGILTIQGFNAGSYLQAFALKKFVESLGIQVEVINTLTPTKVLVSLLNPFETCKKVMNYLTLWSGISSKWFSSNYAQIIIGSDVVWSHQVQQKYLQRYTNKYFNVQLLSKKIIAYAPCSLNIEAKELTFEQIQGIKDLKYCSVRDDKTLNLIKPYRKERPIKVLDPTFLIDWTSYEIATDLKDYILVYTYNNCDNEYYRQMLLSAKELSQKTGKPLVQAIGHPESWCDIHVEASPFEFLGLMRNADYVITNTYHGTLFSIIYNKQFITFPTEYKITDILTQLNIKPCTLVTDYTDINLLLKHKKFVSKTYLREAINDKNEYGIPKPLFPEMASGLKVINKIFQENDIHYWLEGGTLISAVRDNELLPWDNDADISFDVQDITKVHQLKSEFKKYGLQLKGFLSYQVLIRNKQHLVCVMPSYVTQGYYVKMQNIFAVSYYKLEKFLRNNFNIHLEKLDKLFYLLISVGLVLHPRSYSFLRGKREWVKPFSFVEFLGDVFPIPIEVEKYLSFRWGDWRTPHKYKCDK